MRRALRAEVRTYRTLGRRLSPWAPAFHGAFVEKDWHVLLLEDLGRTAPLPWSLPRIRSTAHHFADFHAAHLGRRLPRWITDTSWRQLAMSWAQLSRSPDGMRAPASLAGRKVLRAQRWLTVAAPVLGESVALLAGGRLRRTLLHLDMRSDNVRISRDSLRIFDWNRTSVGPPEFDVANFATSIFSEGGPEPEHFVERYEQRLALDRDVLGAAVSALAGYFASVAWLPPVSGLPRLRAVQRRQLRSSLAWAARIHRLPVPDWLDAVPTEIAG
nr:phosphotransferase [Myxococcus vastator]